MRRFVCLLALFVGLSLVSALQAQGVAPASSTLSYEDVLAAPEASVGKTASWVVRFNCIFIDIGPDGAVTRVRTLFEHRDAGGAWNNRSVLAPQDIRWPEPPFVDRVPQKQPRLLSGTIAAVEQTTSADGRRILTPVLANVTLEALPADGPLTPGKTTGVSWPIVVREVKPQYTEEAMRAKIEGAVELKLVVRADGTIGEVSVIKSLDSHFGLDAKAVEAAKQWLFKPGMKDGKPVATIVFLGLDFRIKRE